MGTCTVYPHTCCRKGPLGLHHRSLVQNRTLRFLPLHRPAGLATSNAIINFCTEGAATSISDPALDFKQSDATSSTSSLGLFFARWHCSSLRLPTTPSVSPIDVTRTPEPVGLDPSATLSFGFVDLGRRGGEN
jgi:hypothetical protein